MDRPQQLKDNFHKLVKESRKEFDEYVDFISTSDIHLEFESLLASACARLLGAYNNLHDPVSEETKAKALIAAARDCSRATATFKAFCAKAGMILEDDHIKRFVYMEEMVKGLLQTGAQSYPLETSQSEITGTPSRGNASEQVKKRSASSSSSGAMRLTPSRVDDKADATPKSATSKKTPSVFVPQPSSKRAPPETRVSTGQPRRKRTLCEPRKALTASSLSSSSAKENSSPYSEKSKESIVRSSTTAHSHSEGPLAPVHTDNGRIRKYNENCERARAHYVFLLDTDGPAPWANAEERLLTAAKYLCLAGPRLQEGWSGQFVNGQAFFARARSNFTAGEDAFNEYASQVSANLIVGPWNDRRIAFLKLYETVKVLISSLADSEPRAFQTGPYPPRLPINSENSRLGTSRQLTSKENSDSLASQFCLMCV